MLPGRSPDASLGRPPDTLPGRPPDASPTESSCPVGRTVRSLVLADVAPDCPAVRLVGSRRSTGFDEDVPRSMVDGCGAPLETGPEPAPVADADACERDAAVAPEPLAPGGGGGDVRATRRGVGGTADGPLAIPCSTRSPLLSCVDATGSGPFVRIEPLASTGSLLTSDGRCARAAPGGGGGVEGGFEERAGEPGGGGGNVLGLLRTGLAGGSEGTGATGARSASSPDSVQPDASSAIRPFVSSPRRRRARSSPDPGGTHRTISRGASGSDTSNRQCS